MRDTITNTVDHKIAAIRMALQENDYKWPERLVTGVMYHQGVRITIEEFTEQKRLFQEAMA